MMWTAGGEARLRPCPAPAAGASADPELFFPISSSGPSLAQAANAKAVCAGCEVRRECLAFALRTHQVHGVWGGLTEQERYPKAQ
jgi:WhiB family transcriptional regulator, redox-sensing transcriptional regulator